MKPVAAIVVFLTVLVILVIGCRAGHLSGEVCEAYVQTIGDVTWTRQPGPPGSMRESATPILPREALSGLDVDELDFVWFQNSAGDYGVCAVDVPAACAVAFVIYDRDALYKEPAELRISTCGPI